MAALRLFAFLFLAIAIASVCAKKDKGGKPKKDDSAMSDSDGNRSGKGPKSGEKKGHGKSGEGSSSAESGESGSHEGGKKRRGSIWTKIALAFAEENGIHLSKRQVKALNRKVDAAVAEAGTDKEKLARVVPILAEGFGYDVAKVETFISEMTETLKTTLKSALAGRPTLQLRPEYVDSVFNFIQENDDLSEVFNNLAPKLNFNQAKLDALVASAKQIDADLQA